MDLQQRDNQLKKLFGIYEETKEEAKEIIKFDNNASDDIKDLNDLYDRTDDLIEHISTQSKEFGKSRDYEVAATLINTAVNIKKQIQEIKQVENPKKPSVQNQQNNYIFDHRQLMDLINGKNNQTDTIDN